MNVCYFLVRLWMRGNLFVSLDVSVNMVAITNVTITAGVNDRLNERATRPDDVCHKDDAVRT